MTALAAAVEDYLALRRGFGHRLVEDGHLLEDFVAYLHVHDLSTITVQAAVGWASAPLGAEPHRIARRLSTIRGFATYRAAFDPATEIPPARLLAAGIERRTPYVFSPAEIDALIAAGRRLPQPMDAVTLPTLIGLMAATGIRSGEAFRLNDDDVDLRGGRILVAYSKFGKSRQLPVHPSTVAALRDYTARRDALRPWPADASLLVGHHGSRLRSQAVSKAFRGLLAEVPIAVAAPRRPPRLTDLRHTFAVTTLAGWHADGLDVQSRLPALSTYLGHANPAHTYWYLQAVPELMGVLADRLEAFLADPS